MPVEVDRHDHHLLDRGKGSGIAQPGACRKVSRKLRQDKQDGRPIRKSGEGNSFLNMKNLLLGIDTDMETV